MSRRRRDFFSCFSNSSSSREKTPTRAGQDEENPVASSPPERSSAISNCFSYFSDRERTPQRNRRSTSTDRKSPHSFTINIDDSPNHHASPVKARPPPPSAHISKRSGIQYNHIYCENFSEEYEAVKFLMSVPKTASPGQLIVNIGGRPDLCVRIPDYIIPGETVVLVSNGPKKRITSTSSTATTISTDSAKYEVETHGSAVTKSSTTTTTAAATATTATTMSSVSVERPDPTSRRLIFNNNNKAAAVAAAADDNNEDNEVFEL